MNRVIRGFPLIGLLLLGLSMPAEAGSFTVHPIRIHLGPKKPTAAIHVTNNSDTQTVVQLQVRKWIQRNGEDHYVPTRDLIATPPIFTMAPHSQQVVRVGLRVPPSVNVERTYRLFLMQVPPPPKPGFEGLQFALRLALPVFVAPRKPAAPALQWSAFGGAEGALKLRVHNAGQAHAHIDRIVVSRPETGERLGRTRGFYLLPGARQTLTLKTDGVPAVGTEIELAVTTDRGTTQIQVVIGK